MRRIRGAEDRSGNRLAASSARKPRSSNAKNTFACAKPCPLQLTLSHYKELAKRELATILPGRQCPTRDRATYQQYFLETGGT
uniref:Long-chain-fatty-acid--CoA ligase n=1 Tax=Steinernema glaseri TaxID=37863 RepID=A0A1I7ZCI3_9BILA